MPRFFFDVNDGSETIDTDGVPLPDLAAARQYVKKMSFDRISDCKRLHDDGAAIIVSVRNQAGAVVVTARLVFSLEPA